MSIDDETPLRRGFFVARKSRPQVGGLELLGSTAGDVYERLPEGATIRNGLQRPIGATAITMCDDRLKELVTKRTEVGDVL